MDWFEVKNKKNKGEIYIYGYITDEKWSDSDVTPKWFKDETDKLNGVSGIDLFINSGGGGVFAAMAISQMINRLSVPVEGVIDGLAASSASWIAMSANRLRMAENALMMIHNPWSMAMGYSEDLRKEADILDKIKESIVTIYNKKSGGKVKKEEIERMMDAETWMNGREALKYGFVDEVVNSKVAANVKNSVMTINGLNVDLTRYKSFDENLVKNNVEPVKKPNYEKLATKLFNIKRGV